MVEGEHSSLKFIVRNIEGWARQASGTSRNQELQVKARLREEFDTRLLPCKKGDGIKKASGTLFENSPKSSLAPTQAPVFQTVLSSPPTVRLWNIPSLREQVVKCPATP